MRERKRKTLQAALALEIEICTGRQGRVEACGGIFEMVGRKEMPRSPEGWLTSHRVVTAARRQVLGLKGGISLASDVPAG